MNDAECFEAHRTHLTSIAYRMLGEMSGAEDVVQEAWLRWNRAEPDEIRDARAWLSAVTVRLALDALRKLRARRESYVGPWLPEPILPDDMRAFAADAPATRAELASDLSLALLHVLERLSPEERAAFILHDAFDCDYPDIAATLGKSEPACRKLVSRARERVKADRPRYSVSSDAHRDLIGRFAQASMAQDGSALIALFSPEVVFYSDGGGQVPAALIPIHGPDKVMRLIVGLMGKFDPNAIPALQALEINGRPGIVITVDGNLHSTLGIETDGVRITAIYLMRNPDKLKRIERAFNRQSAPGSSASA
ncbi:MAG: RNA polymerase sigma factor SigJ [Rhizomicrobium sp.]|jgi:RNA polymerase sigma-70 factor (ECF subfamily)